MILYVALSQCLLLLLLLEMILYVALSHLNSAFIFELDQVRLKQNLSDQ